MVRLIGADGEQIGVVSIAEAIKAAQEAKLDLVEIAPDADPVVCKILDYGKRIFEAKKEKSAARKKQRRMQVKEMKFRPGTDEGDYQVKLRNLTRFLSDGDKAKVTLRFSEKWRTKNLVLICSNELKQILLRSVLLRCSRKWKVDN